MGWYPCCCGGTPPPCSYCTANNADVVVDISGIPTDVCAGCVDLNGTYTLPQDGGDACVWTNNYCFDYCSGDSLKLTLTLEARPLTPSANVGWRLTAYLAIYSGTGCSGSYYALSNVIYQGSSGGTADFDCTAARTLTHYLDTPDLMYGEPCDLDVWTVTVN